MTFKPIYIDRYEQIPENGGFTWYAIKGAKKWQMPACYAQMYTPEYLAIAQVESPMPEVLGLSDITHYIPLRTVME